MRQLTVFNFVTLNGYYKGPDNDISWHRHGEEEAAYSEASLNADNILLFGRTTYEMMASWWPTPMAAEAAPAVARQMNSAQKIVFSNTIEDPKWNNTTVMNGDIIEKIRAIKQQPGRDMTILGSGSIAAQFAAAGLLDGYEIMIDPVILSAGTPLLSGVNVSIGLELTGHRVFNSGVVLLSYKPLKNQL